MTFLNGPCNSLCPALWHHVSNHKEYAVVDWDRRFSVKSMLYNNDVEWRLNDYCFNSKCLFNIDAMAENEDIPPRIMPYTSIPTSASPRKSKLQRFKTLWACLSAGSTMIGLTTNIGVLRCGKWNCGRTRGLGDDSPARRNDPFNLVRAQSFVGTAVLFVLQPKWEVNAFVGVVRKEVKGDMMDSPIEVLLRRSLKRPDRGLASSVVATEGQGVFEFAMPS
ncbi:hypothetical protein P692DRAFT_201804657 [Suillus brevipes Sb2]|nr:hypothetical protein P692DRAFT_201804657 [Suillus brevipes Sb2]